MHVFATVGSLACRLHFNCRWCDPSAYNAASHRFDLLLIVTKAGFECRLVPGKDLQAVCTAVQQRVVSLLENEGDEEDLELKALAAWVWHATMHVAHGLAQVFCRCSQPLVWSHVALSCHTATTDAAPRFLCLIFMDPRQQLRQFAVLHAVTCRIDSNT